MDIFNKNIKFIFAFLFFFFINNSYGAIYLKIKSSVVLPPTASFTFTGNRITNPEVYSKFENSLRNATPTTELVQYISYTPPGKRNAYFQIKVRDENYPKKIEYIACRIDLHDNGQANLSIWDSLSTCHFSKEGDVYVLSLY